MINYNQGELVLQRCLIVNLTAPVRVLLLFEEERVAGDVGRCDEVDLVMVFVMMVMMMVMALMTSVCGGRPGDRLGEDDGTDEDVGVDDVGESA